MEKQTKNKKRPTRTRRGIFANSWEGTTTVAAFPQLQKYFKDCIKEVTNNERYQYN